MKQPDVLKRFRGTRGVLVRKLFWHLYQMSDGDGLIEFAASQLAEELSCSRRSIYRAAKHLIIVNLLEIKQPKLGRGRQSVYRLNWRKKASLSCKPKQPAKVRPTTLEELENWSGEMIRSGLAFRRKCASNKYLKTYNTPKSGNEFRYAMFQFRRLLNDTGLSTGEVRRCCQVLGKAIKGKDKGFKQRLWAYLDGIRNHLFTPQWCWEKPDATYAWFAAIIKKVSV